MGLNPVHVSDKSAERLKELVKITGRTIPELLDAMVEDGHRAVHEHIEARKENAEVNARLRRLCESMAEKEEGA